MRLYALVDDLRTLYFGADRVHWPKFLGLLL
jgi:hypothetical protein